MIDLSKPPPPQLPRKRFIAIATPTLGAVSMEWACALRTMELPLNHGYLMSPLRDETGGEVAETRNKLVVKAMEADDAEHEITHIAWWDDDVIPHPRWLVQLLSHNTAIAAGVYFSKAEPSEPLIFPGPCAGVTPFIPDATFASWGYAMGLSLVRLEVYRTLLGMDLGTDKYGSPAWYQPPSTGIDHEGRNWTRTTEEPRFWTLCLQAGFHAVVDCSRQAFAWHLDLKTRKRYPVKQSEQERTGRAITWSTPYGERSWRQ